MGLGLGHTVKVPPVQLALKSNMGVKEREESVLITGCNLFM